MNIAKRLNTAHLITYSFILIPFFVVNTFIYANLILPKSGDELNYIHILFEWEQEPDAVSYNLQASDEQFFNNIILNIHYYPF